MLLSMLLKIYVLLWKHIQIQEKWISLKLIYDGLGFFWENNFDHAWHSPISFLSLPKFVLGKSYDSYKYFFSIQLFKLNTNNINKKDDLKLQKKQWMYKKEIIGNKNINKGSSEIRTEFKEMTASLLILWSK